jgi:hypothetical protein
MEGDLLPMYIRQVALGFMYLYLKKVTECWLYSCLRLYKEKLCTHHPPCARNLWRVPEAGQFECFAQSGARIGATGRGETDGRSPFKRKKTRTNYQDETNIIFQIYRERDNKRSAVAEELLHRLLASIEVLLLHPRRCPLDQELALPVGVRSHVHDIIHLPHLLYRWWLRGLLDCGDDGLVHRCERFVFLAIGILKHVVDRVAARTMLRLHPPAGQHSRKLVRRDVPPDQILPQLVHGCVLKPACR